MSSYSSKSSASTLTYSLLFLLLSASSVSATGPLFIRQSTTNSTSTNGTNSDSGAKNVDPLGYTPSNVLSVIALGCIAIVAITQTVLMFGRRAVCMIPMLVGEYTWALGFVARLFLHHNPTSKGIFIAFDLLDVLSPCAFIGTNYMILGRMATYLDCQGLLLIRPERIAKVFVISDITTVFIQAVGASMTASDKHATVTLGKNILLVGLIVQLVSFSFFICLFLRFLFGVRSTHQDLWNKDSMKPFSRDWRAISAALTISCILILLRSIYRVIEFTEGAKGPLATNETLFYLLDTLPLFIAVSVYVPAWPTRIVPEFETPGAGVAGNYEMGYPKGGR